MIMPALSAVLLALLCLVLPVPASFAHASEVHVVSVPELNVFRRPTVTSERIATWQRKDEVTAGRLHIDDEGVAWVLACKAQECGCVDRQFIAPRLLPAATHAQWEQHTDRPGLDYHNFEQGRDDPALCQDACLQDPRCRAWTWVKPGLQGNQSRCWLKSAVPDSVRSTCCVSGLALADPADRVAPGSDPADGSPKTQRACAGRPCLQTVGRPSDPPIAMHERARAWAEIVGQIPAGATDIASLGETAISASVEWLYVEYRGIKGWVPAEFLKADADDKPPRSKNGTGDALERLPPLPELEKLK